MRLILALAFALAACQSNASDGELAGAKTQVQRFFTALEAGDCATLATLVPATTGAAECDKFLHEWRDDLKIQLLEISDVRRDGRDARAIIVTTKVKRRGELKNMLVRVTREKGAWQLGL